VKSFDIPARKLRVTEAATFLSVSKSWLDKKRTLGWRVIGVTAPEANFFAE
jgi:hypothetical protein